VNQLTQINFQSTKDS